MRLLYFINSITNSGGIEHIVIDKINYLAGVAGYEVALAYYGSISDKPFYPIDPRVVLKPMGQQSMKASIFLKIASFVQLPQRLIRIIDDVNPDVIVNANTILVSWLLPFVRRNIPKIVELHFSYVGMKIISEEMYGRNWVKKEFNYLLRKFGYLLYDRCVMLTDEDMRDWRFKNAIVIPNFTNIPPIDYNLSEKQNIVVNVGRLAAPKNQTMLVDAWKMVNEKKPDWKLEIWGDGVLHDNLSNQISDLGLEGKVNLMGVSNHIEKVYQYASFFVLSSRYEGHPLVLIEALQSSLPCVCFPVNGVRGTIKNGENGYIIEEMTAEALSNGILKMIEHARDIPAMAQKARESANNFDKEKIMKRWIDLFEYLLSA